LALVNQIRRWVIENDWLDTIVGLPEDLFYNTGIGTYLWILTNNKRSDRQGKVRLIDGRDCGVKMRRSQGKKRQEIPSSAIREIVDLYLSDNPAALQQPDKPKAFVFPGASFGYRKISVIWPRCNEEGKIERDDQGNPLPGKLDTENVPLDESVEEFFSREVLPHRPEAWIDTRKRDDWDGEVGKVGYEINFNRYFYVYTPPRPLEEIIKDIKELDIECRRAMDELMADF